MFKEFLDTFMHTTIVISIKEHNSKTLQPGHFSSANDCLTLQHGTDFFH